MASNYPSDQDMEGALRRHFASEANDLRAPTNLWEALEDRLEPHPAPNPVTRIRRQVLAAAKQNWLPVMVTGGAVAVAASAVLVAGNLGQDSSVADEPMAVAEIREVIKEVPVETIVTQEAITKVGAAPTAAPYRPLPTVAPTVVVREVIKEVEVEKVVTKEVIKEVPVEKIVTAAPTAAMSQPTASAATAAPPRAADAAEAAPARTVRPADTTFQDNRRQPMVATAADAVSTFSLDTDRTSYQLALTWARQGYDIEPDSVRAEEWINAFNYQYAPPADDWGFAITSDLVAHPLDERKHLVRLGFQAAEVADGPPAQRDAGAGRVGLDGRRQPGGHCPCGGGGDPAEPAAAGSGGGGALHQRSDSPAHRGAHRAGRRLGRALDRATGAAWQHQRAGGAEPGGAVGRTGRVWTGPTPTTT